MLWPFLPRPFTRSSDPPPQHSQSSDLPHPQNMPCTPSLARAPVSLPGTQLPFRPLAAHQALFNSPSESFDSQTGDAQRFPKCRPCQVSITGPSPANQLAVGSAVKPVPALPLAVSTGRSIQPALARGLTAHPWLPENTPCSLAGGSARSFCTSLPPSYTSTAFSQPAGPGERAATELEGGNLQAKQRDCCPAASAA